MVPFKMKYGSGGFPFKSALKQTEIAGACTEPDGGCPEGEFWSSAQCKCVLDVQSPSGPLNADEEEIDVEKWDEESKKASDYMKRRAAMLEAIKKMKSKQ